MELYIPAIATQLGLFVGCTVYTVISKTGQVTAYASGEGAKLAGLAIGSGVELVAGPTIGAATQHLITHAGEVWIKPTVQTGSATTAAIAGAVAGVTTSLTISALVASGKYIVKTAKKIKTAAFNQNEMEIELYELQEVDDFTDIVLVNEKCELFDPIVLE